ncbi:hypothetical protein FB45DRAFT_935471 [Roridomyces roridus]|uniref:Cell division cycle protein 123 n=1 Tax=Roridomyces roridus TaxID=1738132 RepID=A0AAD7FEC4_9AGAR|nr:hypothetical protein FB45DRAFT_935471 [Roridomyces roridus]
MQLTIISSAAVDKSIELKDHLFNETWISDGSDIPPSFASLGIPTAKPDPNPTLYGPWMPLITRLRGLPTSTVHTVVLTPIYARTLLEASPVAMLNGRLSESHREDLLEPSPFDHLFPGPVEGYFARLDSASPKDSPFFSGALTSASQVVHQLATSHRASNGLTDALAQSSPFPPRVHFVPWDTSMDTRREYRVFCAPRSQLKTREGRVTAVSQYSWHRRSILADLPREELEAQLTHLLEGIERIHGNIKTHAVQIGMKDKLESEGFVFDVYIHPDTNEVQLLELNPFGVTSLCGSCLFNWVTDVETLYGGREEVEVKISI